METVYFATPNDLLTCQFKTLYPSKLALHLQMIHPPTYLLYKMLIQLNKQKDLYIWHYFTSDMVIVRSTYIREFDKGKNPKVFFNLVPKVSQTIFQNIFLFRCSICTLHVLCNVNVQCGGKYINIICILVHTRLVFYYFQIPSYRNPMQIMFILHHCKKIMCQNIPHKKL